MDHDEIEEQLRQYAVRFDLSAAWWISFQLGLSGWETPPGFLEALGMGATITQEEQGGRPVVRCRVHAVPTALKVATCWQRLDQVARAHGMPLVEYFWLTRV